MIDARMVASKSAYANDGNGNEFRIGQRSLQYLVLSLNCLRLRFLQQCYLTAVIRGMLDRSRQHEAKVIILAGNTLVQSRFFHGGNQSDQFRMSRPQYFYCFAPCRVRCLADLREVFFIRGHELLTLDAVSNHALPGGKVQYQFPDAVSCGNGPRGGGCGIDAIENFHQRGTVPGFAIESDL